MVGYRDMQREVPPGLVDERTLRKLGNLLEFLGVFSMPEEVQERVGLAIVRLRLCPPSPWCELRPEARKQARSRRDWYPSRIPLDPRLGDPE